MTTVENTPKANEIATIVADRCHGNRKPGQAPARYAVIWQAARLGAIEAMKQSAGLNPAAVAGLIEAAEGVRAWAASLTVCDMNEIVADNGITAGMVVGQEAAEQVRRIDRALTAARIARGAA